MSNTFDFTLLEPALVASLKVVLQPGILLGMFLSLFMLLLALYKSSSPYAKFISELLFTVCLASTIFVVMLYSTYKIAALLVLAMLCVVAFAFIERLLLSIRTCSIAPFVEASNSFAVFMVTNQRYVFPMYNFKDLLVVTSTSAGVSCNGVFYRGPVPMSDRCEVITYFASRSMVLDRVEYGGDYTIFVYVDSMYENTTKVTPVKFASNV